MNIDRDAKDNLYLLAFLDTADRLDILLLEVRHLQQSIIDSLHAPTLYLPLRHEEKYIFGGWDSAPEFKNKSASKIAYQSIIRYPSPHEAVDYWSKDDLKGDYCPVGKRLLNRIGEIWTGDIWVRGERQHYHALRALQILKQQIFRDKVHLFKDAKTSGLLNKKDKSEYGLKKAAFLILRRGIHYRIERYISSLKTQQQNFGKSLDFGLQRYPRPSIDRRREIGIFNDFLSNRAIDLRADTLHLMVGLTSTAKKSLPEKELFKNTPMLLHGWSQFMNAKNQQLWDNVGRELDGIDHVSVSKSSQDVSYIDTSFWSPDRPDLQPLVSREIAYSVMRNITKGYSDDYFSNENNYLTQLWVGLSEVLTRETYNKKGVDSIHKGSETLLRYIVTDCLAVSVKGISYLYALFLATVGYELEELLRVDRIIRLEEVNELEGGLHSYEKYYTWYFRLKFTAFWLRETSGFKHLEISSIDKIILVGVDQICEEIIQFLDSCSVKSFSTIAKNRHEPAGKQWSRIYKKLEKYAESSNALKHARKWRECRSRDTWDESKGCSGKKVYHRSTMRLDVRLQNFLFRETVRHKRHKYSPLHEIDANDLLQTFCRAYDLELSNVQIPYMKDTCRQPKNIYRQLHDIPFQCSIMKSIDLLGCLNEVEHQKPSWEVFVKQAHDDMSLGREIFSFALEFYTWGRESPKSRLLLSVNLLSFILPLLETNIYGKLKDLTRALKYWLYADVETDPNKKINISNSVEELMNIVNKSDHRTVLRDYAYGHKGGLNTEKIKTFGAILIDDAFAHKSVNAANKRRLEQLSGYKLKELLQILDFHVQELIDDNSKREDLVDDLSQADETQCKASRLVNNLCLLGNLREFLQIRDDSKDKPAAEGKFYELLLQSFGGNKYKQNGHAIHQFPKMIRLVVVSRLALTNYYSVANPKRLVAEDNNLNGYSLSDILKKDRWEDHLVGEMSTQYSVLLGRYDVVSFTQAKLPCRCRISRFVEGQEIDNASLADEAEKFATHFSRREIALPLELYGHCEFNDKEYSIYAIASVSLQRRTMRLNLVYRLLNACYHTNEQKFSKNSIEARLNVLISKFKNKDRDTGLWDELVIKALLTDGWGDLLLVFMCKKGGNIGKLHEHLIRLQQAFYEDFMIDRTELIYTPQCLDYMTSDENYDLSFSFRFQEDRKLECSIQNFVDALHAKRKKLREKPYELDCYYDVAFTPGQYDVKVSFYLESKKSYKNIYRKIITWFADTNGGELYNKWYRDGLSLVDKIETGIERKK